MDQLIVSLRLIGTALILSLSGCGGPIKPEIPAQLPTHGNDKARIVLTREKQLAGAGSPMVVIDIGDRIEPNGMIYISDPGLEEIRQHEDIASIAGAFVDLLWFDRAAVRPLACGDNGPRCMVYQGNWPRAERGGLLFGHGVSITPDCQVRYEPLLDDGFYTRIMRHELEPVAISVESACFKDHILVPAAESASTDRLQARGGWVEGYRLPSGGIHLLTGPFKEVSAGTGSLYKLYEAEIIANRRISRQVQVIGAVEVGETLIWDRQPGSMRLGAVWYDATGFMPADLEVEAGRTYTLRYTTRFMDQRWALERVE